MAQPQAAALLNRGLQKLSNPKSVKAFSFIGIPLGSRLLIIKQDEVALKNPLLHMSSDLKDNVYDYQGYDAMLSTGTKLLYDVLIYNPETDLYFAIIGTATYNENNTRHYKLIQLDISNILILDGLDDPRFETIQNELYDVISTPQLLTLFEKYGIEAYPKNLQVLNRELLEEKALFIQTLDSKTLNNGFSMSGGLQRVDVIRLYFNNYTLEEIYTIFNQLNTITRNGELNIMEGNIFDLDQIIEEGLVGKITYYSQFSINYKLIPKNPVDIKKYIQSVMVKINAIRQKGN